MSDIPEKNFEFFLKVPHDVRIVMIDKMQIADRCRFSGSSTLCNQEAKSSKNYIHSLSFLASERSTSILISFNEYPQDDENFLGYRLEFKKIFGLSHISCEAYPHKELWRIDLDSSIDVVLHAAEHFKKLLQLHQRKIKGLKFEGEPFGGRLKDYDFEVNNLNNIEILRLADYMDISHYISKLRRPMKILSIGKSENSQALADSELIYQVQDELHLSDTKLTLEQVLRLNATTLTIPYGDWTEMDLANFIEQWERRIIAKTLKRYIWKFSGDSRFDYFRLQTLIREINVPPPPFITERARQIHREDYYFGWQFRLADPPRDQ